MNNRAATLLLKRARNVQTQIGVFQHHQDMWKHRCITTAWRLSLFALQLYISIYSLTTTERFKQKSNACAQCCHSLLCRLCQQARTVRQHQDVTALCTSQLALCCCLADTAHCLLFILPAPPAPVPLLVPPCTCAFECLLVTCTAHGTAHKGTAVQGSLQQRQLERPVQQAPPQTTASRLRRHAECRHLSCWCQQNMSA
jgi:hypothetical protein